MLENIDIDFDFRSDTPVGKDPDSYSPTLRRYHKFLWSKPLPSGTMFTLSDTIPNIYLHHNSELGEFFLSSDSAIHTFSRWPSMTSIISQINDEEIELFRKLAYTIGSMMIFPGNRIGGKATINGARGFHPLIKDRIDLTLECIRRYYKKESSPLQGALSRYSDFFSLFENFKGYVEFFLLQDLVSSDYSTIKFFMSFENFKAPVVPTTVDDYLSYKKLAIEFVNNRNQRILVSSTTVT